jgi:hypothetical protein
LCLRKPPHFKPGTRICKIVVGTTSPTPLSEDQIGLPQSTPFRHAGYSGY